MALQGHLEVMKMEEVKRHQAARALAEEYRLQIVVLASERARSSLALCSLIRFTCKVKGFGSVIVAKTG
jgi:hypothetical protein